MTEMFSSIQGGWWVAYGVVFMITLVALVWFRGVAVKDGAVYAALQRFRHESPETHQHLLALGVAFYRGRDGDLARSPNDRLLVRELPSALYEATWSAPIWVFASAFTALGLVGTFVGLQNAAVKFKDTLSSPQTGGELDVVQFQALLTGAVQGFIENMGTAFGTSIVGLGTATLVSIFYAFLPKAIQPKARTLLEFQSKFEVVTPEELLYRAQEADLSTAAAKLGAGASRLADAAGKMDSETMGRIVSTSIERALGPVLGDISGALRELNEQNKEQTSKVLKGLVDELRREVLEPMAQAVRENTQQNEALRSKIENLVSQLPMVTNAVATSAHAMKTFATQTQKDLDAFTEKLGGVLTNFTTDSQAVFAQIPSQVESALSKVRGDIQTMLKTTRDAFEQQNQSFQDFTQESQRQMTDIRDGSIALMREQHANLQAIAQESAKVMTQAKEELVAGIHVIPKMLDDTRRESQDQLEKFQAASLESMDRFRTDYQAQLTAFFEAQSVQLEATLGKQREGLSRVVSQLTQAYADEAGRRAALGERVDGQLARLGDINQQLTELNGRMNTWMPKVSADLHATQSAAVDHVTAMQNMLRGIVSTQSEQLHLITTHHQAAMERMSTTTENMHSELDRSVSEICKSLAGVASMLVTGRDAQHQPTGRA